VADQQQADKAFRLRQEAARLRRVAEGLNSKADRDIIRRLAEETDRAAAASENGRAARNGPGDASALGLAEI